MTGYILDMTLSFSVLHRPSGVMVDTTTTETFQAPLPSLEACHRQAALREASARRNLGLLGIGQVRFEHACLPAGGGI